MDTRPRPNPTGLGLALLSAVAVGVVGGCDLPTELPRWDTVWDVAVVTDTVATAALLPEGVRASGEGFVVDSFRTESSVRLRDVCELCTCFDGPIPELEIAPTDFPVRLPAGVLSADIVRGFAEIVLHNEVGFDVLRDEEGDRGFLLVELTDSWTDEVLQSVLVDEPFPPGDSLALTLELPRIELSSRYVARVSGRTPGSGCDTVPLTPESGFRSRIDLQDVVSSGVEVIVSDAALRVPSRDFDLPGWLAERLRPEDAEVTVEVEVESRVPVRYELELSVASDPAELFSERAALFTPLVVDGAAGEVVTRRFLLDLERIRDADRLVFESRSRVLGSRIVRLDGDEAVTYRVRLLARVPTR